MDAEWSPVATAAQTTLDNLDAVMLEVRTAIRENVPGYSAVTDEQLSEASTRNIQSILQALRDRRRLSEQDLQDFAATVEARARSGVPLDEYLLAVATAEAVMWDLLWQRAGDVPEARRLEAFAIRFANMNAITRTTAAAHRRIEITSAREDQERRAFSLRALLQEGVAPHEAPQHLVRLGLATDRAYYVVRARGRDLASSELMPREVAGEQHRPPHAAFGLWGDDTVGLLLGRPAPGAGITVGVAGPASMAELAAAYAQASAAFDTAWALGLSGAYDQRALGVRAAVQALPDVGEALRQRYVTPLTDSGNLGDELLATVRTFLETGSRREAAAAALHLHTNTVGYRLRRFHELTGADLSDLTTLAELAWLFIDMDLRPQEAS